MKKILLFLIILATNIFAKYDRVEKLETIKTDVKEILYINGEKREKEYNIEYISPDYLRKVIISPKINRGEVYLYEKGINKVYLPVFDEVIIEKNNEDVSNFLSLIKELKEKERVDKQFRANYCAGRVKEIKYQKRYRLIINKYKAINNILIPVDMDIYEKNIKICSLNLSDITVNSNIIKKDIKR